MQYFVQRSDLRDLYEKVAGGTRISESEALRLFESKDLNAVGAIADFARQRKCGDRASYILNRYINYSNYCILSCQFCAFARKKRDADGFQFSIEEMVAKAREALKIGITELHIVGGLHPNLPFSYYSGMLQSLRATIVVCLTLTLCAGCGTLNTGHRDLDSTFNKAQTATEKPASCCIVAGIAGLFG